MLTISNFNIFWWFFESFINIYMSLFLWVTFIEILNLSTLIVRWFISSNFLNLLFFVIHKLVASLGKRFNSSLWKLQYYSTHQFHVIFIKHTIFPALITEMSYIMNVSHLFCASELGCSHPLTKLFSFILSRE